MIVSLISLGNSKWLFAGVYRVLGCEPHGDDFKYDTELIEGQNDIIGRLVVHHKRAARGSYRNGETIIDECHVAEVYDRRLSVEEFPGYQHTCVSFDKLQTIVEQGVPSWKAGLSSVKGVYLITDTSNGKVYVGSATGEDGIWQRWCDYSANGHGGNKDLRKLLKEKGVDHRKNFQYVVLEIADLHTQEDQIVDRESYWKRALCSREFGYNMN